MLIYLKHFLSFCSCTTLKIFRNAVCVYACFCFLPIASEDESLHRLSKHQNKYCIVITPVEQSLQPVDYAW